MKKTLTAQDIFGDMYIDVNAITLEELKKCEDISISFTTSMFYKALISSPFVEACINGKTELVDPRSIKDYSENFAKVAGVIRQFGKFIQKYGDKLNQVKREGGFLHAGSGAVAYKVLEGMLVKAEPYFDAASKIEDLNAKETSKREYLRVVSILNGKAAKAIKQVERLAAEENGWIIGDEDIFQQTHEAFTLVTNQFDVGNLEETKDMGKRVVVFETNEKEQARLSAIAKANDLYDYFVIDFLRDVEAQTPYTARYMVKQLNEKHEKFKRSFEMPLASDTSLGKANECISQINGMIDFVSKISEASYVVSGYQK